MSDEPVFFADSISRMFATVWPNEKYPGPEEAANLVEDFLASTVDWQARMQHAHDVIQAVVRNRDAHHLMPAMRRGLNDSLDTLCWALGHKKNKAFDYTLGLIESVLNAVGAEVPALETR